MYGEEEFVTVPLLQYFQMMTLTFLHQLPNRPQEHFLVDNNEEKRICHEEMVYPAISPREVDLTLKTLV